MKKGLSLIFGLLAVLFLPCGSGAEINKGTFEISPFFGYCTGATSHDLCHKDVYGLRLGYNITSRWEVEAALEEFGPRSATMLHLDALYHFLPEKAFNPFLIAGIGGAHVRSASGGHYNTAMGDVGAGFKYAITPDIAYRTEIRDVITHFQNSVVTAGFTFTLGKKPSSVPEARVSEQEVPPPAPPKEEMKPLPQEKIEKVPVPPPPPAAPREPSAAPEKPSPAPEVPPKPVEEEVSILQDIHFDFNKTVLTPSARKVLDRNIEILKANPGMKVVIEGYACAHGNQGINKKISDKRARRVKQYMVKHGISAQRLTIAAYGKKRLAMPEIPTKTNKNSEESKANRRVHFRVISK